MPVLLGGLTLKTSSNYYCSHSLQIRDSNHTYLLTIVMALGQWLPMQTEKKSIIVRNGGPTTPEGSRFMQNRRKMAHPVPSKAFLQTSPEAAMLFAPFGCTHPPPPVSPFLLVQNLSPKDITGSDITSTKSADWVKFIKYAIDLWPPKTLRQDA